MYFVPWDTDLSLGVTWGYDYEESMNEIIERYELPAMKSEIDVLDAKFVKRWKELRQGIYSEENVLRVYKELTEKINFFEGEPIKFNEDFYKYCVDEGGMFVTPKNLQISCRVIKGTSIENGKNIDLHYNHAQNILNKINEYNLTK